MPLVHSQQFTQSDADLLNALTAPTPPQAKAFARRDAALDPLLIAAAAASGPHVTRNHYHHDFFPGVMLPQAEGAMDWSKFTGEDSAAKSARQKLTYVSRQAPRRQRLGSLDEESKENNQPEDLQPLKETQNVPSTQRKRRSSVASITDHKVQASAQALADVVPSTLPPEPVHVRCMARTRIPTPHGPIFLHIYHNNRDNKEHLAVVVDPAQLSESSDSPLQLPPIRSKSLDAVWSENETAMDRIVRGAYVGKLSQTSQTPSAPVTQVHSTSSLPVNRIEVPPPLIRIHSECFTGETIGSMRCDCGEQLDEAIRQISQPIHIPPTPDRLQEATTIPGRGAVIYLRQEGRGIGLLSKIRAYNLQDMGHDTVTANLMLGHKADERGYEIAAAILRDLGLGAEGANDASAGVRVLTNNPDKVEALEKEGIHVASRVPMIPRSWQQRQAVADGKSLEGGDAHIKIVGQEVERISGATLIGGNAVHGEDLDKYLRTKVLRMGHMLPLWMQDAPVIH
ncbi:GTP cyclohydrolase II-domain-containing protein [Panaeolus papilionaceus]|nr:GTP cyclohydrolase II-domain-containing protein [Panaeolus papilionaceus]